MKINQRVHRLAAISLLTVIIIIFLDMPSVLAQLPKPALSLRLLTSNYNNPITPGVNNPLRMVISNNGNRAVTNVRLSSYPPKDWVVELSPQTIARMEANEIQTVNITVIPPEDARRGYFNITITAEASETTGILDFSVNIERTTSTWLWIGIALAAIVIGGFVFVFIKYGR